MEKNLKCITSIFLLMILCFFPMSVKAEDSMSSKYQNKTYLDAVYEQQKEELIELGVLEEEKTFKYVAIGNSPTIHEINELWHGDWGMAATSKDSDYVHIVSKALEEKENAQVDLSVISCKEWELGSDRRGSLLQAFDSIPEDADLITIQTGENITTFTENLDGDYDTLFGYIKSKVPNAQILVLGEVLWPQEAIENAKRNACAKYGMPFIDMTEFLTGYNDGSYRSALETVIVGADGNSYAIDNECVAAHPNDAGMAKIAEIVIRSIP